MQQGEHFFQEILSSTFNGSSGEVSLLRNGDRDNRTIVVSVDNLMKDGRFVEVGEVRQSDDPATQLNFNLSAITWADGTHQVPGDGIEAEEARTSSYFFVGWVALAFLIIATFLVVAWRRERVAKQRAQKQLEQRKGGNMRVLTVVTECASKAKGRDSCWGQSVSHMLPPVAEEEFHVFMSHTQTWGADQVAQIKSKLTHHVPGLKCFLDVGKCLTS
jgi:hypothetical protein